MPLLNNPTLLIIAINITLIIGNYLWYLPCFVRADWSKLLWADTLSTVFAITAAGILFWGKGIDFSLFGWQVNWFVFSLLSYFLIELPFAIIYSLRFLK